MSDRYVTICGHCGHWHRTASTHSNGQYQQKMMGKWRDDTNEYKMMDEKKSDIMEHTGGDNSGS